MRVSDAASIWMTTWNSSSLFLRHARARTHAHTHTHTHTKLWKIIELINVTNKAAQSGPLKFHVRWWKTLNLDIKGGSKVWGCGMRRGPHVCTCILGTWKCPLMVLCSVSFIMINMAGNHKFLSPFGGSHPQQFFNGSHPIVFITNKLHSVSGTQHIYSNSSHWGL